MGGDGEDFEKLITSRFVLLHKKYVVFLFWNCCVLLGKCGVFWYWRKILHCAGRNGYFSEDERNHAAWMLLVLVFGVC